MPTGTLPESGKKIWERVYDQAKADGDDQETAARKAWGAVKNAGWHKDKDGNWVKRAELQEFSLTIRKATLVDNEMRWRADTSDVDADLYDDNMSVELFADFIDRINRTDLPPEPIREHYVSSYWKGGMPYLSLSHYADLDGSAVPGIVDGLFVDGKFLKAKGRLYDSPLGQAVWRALKTDLEKRSDSHDPVRISIAFLDYEHRHKDTGTVFTRSFTDPEGMICRECQENSKKHKMGGKVFLKGLLIHLAMTRVPVNQRTIMEVEKAMTTRKEDAESIVGADLAAEIDVKSQLVGKAELDDMVVTRADEDAEEDAPIEVPNPSATVDLSSVLEVLNSLAVEVRSLSAELRAYKKDDKSPGEKEDTPEDEDEDKKEKEMKSEVLEAVSVFDPQSLTVALSEAMNPTVQRLDILIAALSQKTIPASAAPERRSIPANSVQQIIPGQNVGVPQPGKPQSISDFVRRSVGG